MSSYFAINSRAVLNFFNPIKSKQFVTNYMLTTVSLRENEPHSVGCLRSVNLVLIFESIFQLYLYFCPSSSHRLIFFDCLEQSNNFPDVLKCNLSAILLMTVHLFHVMYVRISSERGFELFYNYYVHGDKTFVHAPRWQLNKLVVFILNLYQVLPVACGRYFQGQQSGTYFAEREWCNELASMFSISSMLLTSLAGGIVVSVEC